jgi:hypothetical protein
VKQNDGSGRDEAQEHATFLRAILSLDGGDPSLPRLFPPVVVKRKTAAGPRRDDPPPDPAR